MYKLQIVSSLERLFVSHHGMPLEKTATIKLIHSVFDSIGMPLNYPLINSISTELSVCLLAGCRSSVAERLCVMQAVLGSIPSGDQIFLILIV